MSVSTHETLSSRYAKKHLANHLYLAGRYSDLYTLIEDPNWWKYKDRPGEWYFSLQNDLALGLEAAISSGKGEICRQIKISLLLSNLLSTGTSMDSRLAYLLLQLGTLDYSTAISYSFLTLSGLEHTQFLIRIFPALDISLRNRLWPDIKAEILAVSDAADQFILLKEVIINEYWPVGYEHEVEVLTSKAIRETNNRLQIAKSHLRHIEVPGLLTNMASFLSSFSTIIGFISAHTVLTQARDLLRTVGDLYRLAINHVQKNLVRQYAKGNGPAFILTSAFTSLIIDPVPESLVRCWAKLWSLKVGRSRENVGKVLELVNTAQSDTSKREMISVLAPYLKAAEIQKLIRSIAWPSELCHDLFIAYVVPLSPGANRTDCERPLDSLHAAFTIKLRDELTQTIETLENMLPANEWLIEQLVSHVLTNVNGPKKISCLQVLSTYHNLDCDLAVKIYSGAADLDQASQNRIGLNLLIKLPQDLGKAVCTSVFSNSLKDNVPIDEEAFINALRFSLDKGIDDQTLSMVVDIINRRSLSAGLLILFDYGLLNPAIVNEFVVRRFAVVDHFGAHLAILGASMHLDHQTFVDDISLVHIIGNLDRNGIEYLFSQLTSFYSFVQRSNVLKEAIAQATSLFDNPLDRVKLLARLASEYRDPNLLLHVETEVSNIQDVAVMLNVLISLAEQSSGDRQTYYINQALEILEREEEYDFAMIDRISNLIAGPGTAKSRLLSVINRKGDVATAKALVHIAGATTNSVEMLEILREAEIVVDGIDVWLRPPLYGAISKLSPSTRATILVAKALACARCNNDNDSYAGDLYLIANCFGGIERVSIIESAKVIDRDSRLFALSLLAEYLDCSELMDLFQVIVSAEQQRQYDCLAYIVPHLPISTAKLGLNILAANPDYGPYLYCLANWRHQLEYTELCNALLQLIQKIDDPFHPELVPTLEMDTESLIPSPINSSSVIFCRLLTRSIRNLMGQISLLSDDNQYGIWTNILLALAKKPRTHSCYYLALFSPIIMRWQNVSGTSLTNTYVQVFNLTQSYAMTQNTELLST